MSDAFTFEELYDLLRAEKYSTDLQKLDESTLKKIKNYLKTKKRLLKEAEQSGTGHSQLIKLRNEIESAYRVLKDLYEQREQKIIRRALFTCRAEQMIKDTTNMLNNEVELYENLIQILKKNYASFEQMLNDEEHEESKPKELKVERLKLIRLLEPLPKLVGPDGAIYGPFEQGDIAN